jgi:hypothetical protein
MHISADCYWGLNGLDIGFFEKKGLHSAAKNLHGLLWDHFALENCFDQSINVHDYTKSDHYKIVSETSREQS